MNGRRLGMPMPSKPPVHAPTRRGRVAGLGGVIGLHVAALALAWSTSHDTGERTSAAAAPVLRVQLLSPAAPPPMPPQPLPRPPLQAPPGWDAELPVPVVAPVRAVAAMPAVLPGAVVAVSAEAPIPAPVPAPAAEAVLQAAAEAPPRQRVAADHSACARVPHPAVLRERGIEGRVQLRVQVGADGRARQVQLQGSSGWRLFDEAALAQVRDCRFRPALEGDAAVESWVEFAVRFALNQS